jgi:hypothetical protein
LLRLIDFRDERSRVTAHILYLLGYLTRRAEIVSTQVRSRTIRHVRNQDFLVSQRCLGVVLKFLSFLLARSAQVYNLAELINRILEPAYVILLQALLAFGKQLFLLLTLRNHLIEIISRIVFSPATGRQVKDFAKILLGLRKLRFIGVCLRLAPQLIFLLQHGIQARIAALVGRRHGRSRFRLDNFWLFRARRGGRDDGYICHYR